LTNEGLVAALEERIDRLPRGRLASPPIGRLPRDIEAAVYFCCDEALLNVARHAGQGATATVELAATDLSLRFSVRDDGAGFDPGAAGSGLQTMADRLGAVGGRFAIDSRTGEGTTVSGSVPLVGSRD
jgi:signal transduction histidine kinase